MSAPGTRKYRALAILVLFAALYVGGKLAGVGDQLNVEAIRTTVHDAGAWGFAVYFAAFSLGELFHVPGMVFVVAGILAFGKVLGFALALAAAIVSVSVTFVLVRSIGGKALLDIERPWVKAGLAKLDAQPIRAVILLRTFLWLAPGLNYALALSNIRYRDYLAGSVLGLIAPILAMTFLFDWLLARI